MSDTNQILILTYLDSIVCGFFNSTNELNLKIKVIDIPNLNSHQAYFYA